MDTVGRFTVLGWSYPRLFLLCICRFWIIHIIRWDLLRFANSFTNFACSTVSLVHCIVCLEYGNLEFNLWILIVCLCLPSFQFLFVQIHKHWWGRQSVLQSSSGWFLQLALDSSMWSARILGGSLRSLNLESTIPVWTSMFCLQKQRWSEILYLRNTEL